ncbi:hypothetical protein DSL72_009003 [Monilinia vaccinii-corymbosi]|uniref:Uncharacterized protein n=1 Tax=Monilinia vaccinii-corymbosi TaxID=61207 RepID=A0A8A3PPH5_9HELO|nr:hypothetical protein DSL72_009003 [Monilinia vaccinii-corymbosi]
MLSGTEIRDFSPPPGMKPPNRAVGFDMEAFPTAYEIEPSTSIQSAPDSIMAPSPVRRRSTRTRSNTFRTVDLTSRQPEWQPGQEPGLDPSRSDGGRSTGINLHEEYGENLSSNAKACRYHCHAECL